MDEIKFKINGKIHAVGCEVSSDLTLVDYIRNVAELRGTKYMCREGGCGACIVSVKKTPGATPEAINSCLVLVTSCDGWDITTIEKVGNRRDGYSKIQTTLAAKNGTQCGYCTPGFVMAMYSLKESKKNRTMLEIERSFGSNVCRCTGYRPILEAFKQFASDNPDNILDIEDLKICEKTGKECHKDNCSEDGWCVITKADVRLEASKEIDLSDGKKWFKVNTVAEIFTILNKEGDDSYMLVAGNTAKGVYPISEYPRVLIDIHDVPELLGQYTDQNLVIGACTTLTDTLEIFLQKSTEENFSYLKKLYDHLSLVAHIAVRNLGTIAGNLMIKNQHNEFPSDIFLMFETVGAQLTIQDPKKLRPLQKRTVTMKQFLALDMRGKVILNVLLPPLSSEYKLVTFKIMPKAQNAHAIVNAGFLYKLNDQNVVQSSRIVYGGLSSSYIRSTATERYLLGKKLFLNETLKTGLSKLNGELVVTENPPDASVEFRRQLALNLFYKGLLILCPSKELNSRFVSGAQKIRESRPVSQGRQIYDTNKTLWPLNQPVQKLEALIQCSGEAFYTEDIPTLPHEVFAAFALSTVAQGNIVSINAKKALAVPGVIAFYSADDIPSLNSFTPAGTPFYSTDEELLCGGKVKYYNQPLGIVVAETRVIAERAARLVEATYSNITAPVLDIKEAKKDPSKNTLIASSDATKRGSDVTKVIKSDNTIYSQYHFSMETLVCVTNPKEDCLDVYAATQYLDAVQLMVSRALNIDQNKIVVRVIRLGGAYGIKISRVNQVAVACSLVSLKLNRPCRFIQSLTTNMRAVGKRFPCSVDFEVGVNSSGVIQYNNYTLYEDNGYLINEPLGSFGTDVYYNCYKNTTWNYKSYNTVTDTAKNTFCRSPGTMENIVMAECLMERISYEISKDSLEVRLANLDEEKFGALKEMIENLKTNADYARRRAEVDKFNSENRWTKIGLKFAISRWSPVGSTYFDVTLSVYHGDGTIDIVHGGIEMGQGVNTKAAQVCAYKLNVPLSKIKIKGTNTISAPNSFAAGGSLTSLSVAMGVAKACDELLNNLEPTKKTMDNPTWEALVEKAFKAGVDLQAHGFISAADVQNYNIYGVALAEIKLDLLTFESEFQRLDLIQDVGQSISPEIDVGQIEGAMIMGLGYWTSEDIKLNKTSGEVITNRTWNYYVPQALDIPQDFRVYFRKGSYSKDVIFGAKATGEPPICVSEVVPFALREAITACRSDGGIPSTTWFQIDGPWTLEKMGLACATKTEHFAFN